MCLINMFKSLVIKTVVSYFAIRETKLLEIWSNSNGCTKVNGHTQITEECARIVIQSMCVKKQASIPYYQLTKLSNI